MTTERRELVAQAGGAEPEANLVVPEGARGVVVIAGGPEDDAVLGRMARDLQEGRLGTMLLHLRTPEEARHETPWPGPERAQAADRILGACRRLARQRPTSRLGRGLLAMGRAATPALLAAGERDAGVGAVVCVDGRFEEGPPAGAAPAPALLLVSDDAMVPAGETLLDGVAAEKELQVVKSSHRSIEERTEKVSAASIRWFARHLRGR